MISTETKVKMSLEEIQYIERLEENNNKLKKEVKELRSDYYSLKDNLEVLELEDWIIHRTYDNNEYVSGYLVSEKNVEYY